MFDNGGQTCNNLWSYVQVLIECMEKHEKAYILFHDKQIDKFPRLLNNSYLKFPFYTKSLRKYGSDRYLIRFIRGLLNNRLYNLVPFLIKKYGTIFSCPWYTTLNNDIPPQYREPIKQYFIPSEYIRHDVDSQFALYSNNIIVGVHVRRGDYSTWHDGRYYYSLDQYADCCKTLMKHFKDKKVVFFLSSNEKLKLDNSWTNIPNFMLSDSSPIHDLYALSKCNYIIGPPSTFSSWASFMGNVPLAYIYDPNSFAPIFRTIVSYLRYDTGEQVVHHPYLLNH